MRADSCIPYFDSHVAKPKEARESRSIKNLHPFSARVVVEGVFCFD